MKFISGPFTRQIGGECGSAALALFQCGDVRTAVQGCAFFIHNLKYLPEIDCEQYDEDQLGAEIRNMKLLHDELVTYQSDRCGMRKSDWLELARAGSVSNKPILNS
mgnify:CR=1 FL=1